MGVSGMAIVLFFVVFMAAYSVVSIQQLFLIKINPVLNVEIGLDMVILVFPTHSLKYKIKHLIHYGDRLVLKFPYNFTRFYTFIPIE